MTDLKALAARCVDLDGPSYAMDCEIWDAVYPGERQARFQKLNAPGSPYHGRLHPFDMDGYVKPLKSFTASIDAAMTLVPDGWCVWQMGEVPDNSPINWHVTLWQDGAINPGDCSQAATPALAICAAALIAREASNGDL